MSKSQQSQTALEKFREELDRNYRGPLLAYFVRRVHNRHEAEDLTQEVFVRLLHQHDVDPARAKSYVFTIAANLLRDRLRRAVTRQTTTFGAFEDDRRPQIPALVEEISAERVLVARETLRDVLQALDGLGTRTRDIFVLYRIERMKQHEIATLLGLSHGAVEKHLVKAMTYLTNRFERP